MVALTPRHRGIAANRGAHGSRLAREVRVARGALVLGLAVAAAAQLLAPLPAPPLYDGVIPVEAYRWLSPPPGAHGGALSASQTIPVSGASSPLVAVATAEVTPQAQLFAQPGGLTLPPGTTSLSVSITPVQPAAQPLDGHIAGNVYRISVTTQSGEAVTAPASAEVTVVLRAPDPTATEGTVALLSNGTWQPLKTDASGLGASFVTVVTSFGDFALLQSGPGPSVLATGLPTSPTSPGASASPASSTGTTEAPAASTPPASSSSGLPPITIVAGIATGLVLLALVALAVLPRRPKRRDWTDRRG